MTGQNVFLVKPTEKAVSNLALYVVCHLDGIDLNLDHQLYIPGRFILGHFREKNGDFALSPRGIFYTTSPQDLQKYQERIDSEEFRVVRVIDIPGSELELLTKQAEASLNARSGINQRVSSFGQYSQ